MSCTAWCLVAKPCPTLLQPCGLQPALNNGKASCQVYLAPKACPLNVFIVRLLCIRWHSLPLLITVGIDLGALVSLASHGKTVSHVVGMPASPISFPILCCFYFKPYGLFHGDDYW